MRHIGLRESKPQSKVLIGIGVLVAAALVILALRSFSSLVFALVIIALNAVLELHKRFTHGLPIDLELLTAGVAYLAATGSLAAALIVALFGPFTAEAVRGQLSRAAFLRPLSLAPVLVVAPLFGASSAGLLLSVLVGVAATFVRVMLTARFYLPYTVFARVTQFALSAYVVVFLLPLL